ncbi:MAG: YjbH domain-containing protein, partial [Armatimonadota bacterium]
ARVTGKTGLGQKYHRTPLLVSWRHKLSGIDTTVVGRWGRFIGAPEVRRIDAWPYWVAETSEDKGFSLSLISAFRQKEFVLSYADTNRGQLLAVGIVLPLSGRELPDPASIRVRPEESFNYTYRSTGSSRAVALPDIPFTDDWRLLMFPAYLKDYVDYLRSPSEGLARAQRGVELRESIGPSLSGSTGLLMIPTADVEPYGSMSIGANFLGKRWRRYAGRLVGHGTMAQYITLGVVPSWEITVRLTNLKGNLWAQKFNIPDMDPNTADTGWNVDRMASVQWQVLRETATRPAVAVGAQDVTADFGELGESVMYWERYVVASKHFGKLGVHTGLGGSHKGQEPRLKGLFGGADYRFARNAWILMDIDRKFKFRIPGRRPEPHGREVNIGIRALLANRFQVDVFSPGLSTASAGLAYRVRL